MAKHLKKLKTLLMSEDMTQKGISTFLKAKGFKSHSTGYVSSRMTGRENWDTEEMYALAEWLGIPDGEILDYFPRRR